MTLQVHLVEVTPTDLGGAPVPLYLSDWGYTTTPSDPDAPNRNYWPLARQPYSFRASLPLDQILVTQAESSAGDALFDNADGKLDPYLGLIWDGAPYRVLRGPQDGAYAAFTPIFAGRVQGIDWTRPQSSPGQVTLRLRDPREFLSLPIALHTYAGTGGLEGPDALAGTLKPRGYGFLLNITPILVDPSTLTYQVNDGPVENIEAVYDKGVRLSRVDSAPGLGQYQALESQGIFLLGGSPAGIITADVLCFGDDGDGTAAERRCAQRILRKLLAEFYPDVPRDEASFIAAERTVLAGAGLYLTQARTLLDVLPELLAGDAQALVFTALGLATVVTPDFTAPPVATVMPLTTPEGHLDFERVVTPPPAWRLRIGTGKNYTVMTGTQVAGSSEDVQGQGGVDVARRQLLALPYHTFVRQDPSIRTLHPFAADPDVIVTALQGYDHDGGGNFPEMDRLFALVSTARRRYRLKCWAPTVDVQLAQVVTLQHPRGEPDLAHGLTGVVATLERDATTDAVTLEVVV